MFYKSWVVWASFQIVHKYAHLAPEYLANYADRLDDNWHNSDTLENVIPIINNKQVIYLILLVAMGGIEPPTSGL